MEFPLRPHLASLVEDLRRHGRQTAIVSYQGVRRHATTYAELATLAGRFAAELDRRHIAAGDRVILWGDNSAEWIAAFFGCLLRGALAVPLDVAGSPEFAARVIADVSPKLILADTARLAILHSNLPHLSLNTPKQTLPSQSDLTVASGVALDSPFQIVFTSGTISEPKGIVHTHRNVLASLEPIEREIAKYRRYERIVHPLRFLHTLPLSHVFGQFMGLWIPALLAAEVHFEAQLESARMIERIHRNRISVLVSVPRSLELLRVHIQNRFPGLDAQLVSSAGWPILKRMWKFRSVHRVTGWKFWALISGGATLPPELELFWGRLGYAVIQGYGMTETAALITLNHPFHVGRGTLGKPLPGREVHISPEGEILVRGDVVSSATWANGSIQRRSGEWLATGDLATQDASGELRFSGRRGDTIVTAAGLNVHPIDLEAELLKQPEVQGAVVVGHDGPSGQEPIAVVISSTDDAHIRLALEQANRSLASFQQIRHILRWPEPSFPFTSTGKLLRRVVASWAQQQLAPNVNHLAIDHRDPLLEMIASITGEMPTKAIATARLTEDLHLDSLGRVQLQSLLEQRFGIELADEQIAQAATLGDLRMLFGSPLQTFDESSLSVKPGPQDSAQEIQHPSKLSESPALQVRTATSREHRYPQWTWLAIIDSLRVAFQELIVRPLVWLLAGPRIELPGHPLPTNAPMLIIANHITAYDVPLILYGLPPILRHRVAVAMSGEMLLDFRQGRGAQNAWLKPLLPIAYWSVTILFNVFPLPRFGGFRRSFEHAGRALDKGYSVLIFPEGQRSAEGTLQPFRSGIGLLAQQAAPPVLPVALIGLGNMKRTGRGWLRSGRLTVRIGDPIPYNPDNTPEQTTRKLQVAVAALMQDA